MWRLRHMFANTPEHCFIINDDVSKMAIPDELDKDYYIRWIYERLEDFGVTFDTLGGGAVTHAII